MKRIYGRYYIYTIYININIQYIYILIYIYNIIYTIYIYTIYIYIFLVARLQQIDSHYRCKIKSPKNARLNLYR